MEEVKVDSGSIFPANVIAIIPAYNEEKSIAKVLLLTQRHVDKVIVCDDGSMDMTAEIAERVGCNCGEASGEHR